MNEPAVNSTADFRSRLERMDEALRQVVIERGELRKQNKKLLEMLKWALPHMAEVPLSPANQALRDRFAKRLVKAEALVAKAEEMSRG